MIIISKRHELHSVSVHKTRQQGPHYAALRCEQCNKHIQWLNQVDADFIQKLLEEEKKNDTQ